MRLSSVVHAKAAVDAAYKLLGISPDGFAPGTRDRPQLVSLVEGGRLRVDNGGGDVTTFTKEALATAIRAANAATLKSQQNEDDFNCGRAAAVKLATADGSGSGSGSDSDSDDGDSDDGADITSGHHAYHAVVRRSPANAAKWTTMAKAVADYAATLDATPFKAWRPRRAVASGGQIDAQRKALDAVVKVLSSESGGGPACVATRRTAAILPTVPITFFSESPIFLRCDDPGFRQFDVERISWNPPRDTALLTIIADNDKKNLSPKVFWETVAMAVVGHDAFAGLLSSTVTRRSLHTRACALKYIYSGYDPTGQMVEVIGDKKHVGKVGKVVSRSANAYWRIKVEGGETITVQGDTKVKVLAGER